MMIRRCVNNHLETVFTIINDAAEVYRGVIPEDRWKIPYMSNGLSGREESPVEKILVYSRTSGGNFCGTGR